MSLLSTIPNERTRLEIEESLLFFDICHLKTGDQNKFDSVAQRTVDLEARDSETQVIELALGVARHRSEHSSRTESLAVFNQLFIAIWKAARDKGDGQEQTMVIALNQLAAARRSHLNNDSLWQSLSLPSTPSC